MDLSDIPVDEEAVKAVASIIVTRVVPLIIPGAAPIAELALEIVIPIAREIIRVAKSDHFSDEELDALNKVINEQSAKIQQDPDADVQPAPV